MQTLMVRSLKLLFCAATVVGSAPNPPFRGTVALADTRHAVSFGERPSGSPANLKLRDWIVAELKPTGAQVSLDAFSGRTPDGPVPMANVIGKFAGTSGKAIAITGHFDTKKIAGVHFLGANDAGSSTGFLLEFARVLAKMKHRDDIYLVFFDGEEARRDWTDADSLYGSRHLAAKRSADGTNRRLKALINVDMTGDKNLRVWWDTNSAASLRGLIWDIADSLGYSAAFPRQGGGIDDDHMPFLNAGVRAADLIDFDSQNTFWHKPADTMDKLSARSFEIIGAVLMKTIEELEQQK